MRQTERASIIRIVSDLIKSDGIIDLREIDFLDDLRERYGITKADEVLSDTLTLGQALDTIAATDGATRHALMNDFTRVAMSDNFCAKEEALLLICLRLMLTLQPPCEVSVVSADASVVTFENSQILYLESTYEPHTNELMQTHYREICAEVRLHGFELVYLPKVSEHYSSIAEADFMRIAAFLYPKVSQERLYAIMRQMQHLSTASFCTNQLATKLAVEAFRSVHPSFLIKIGESTVADRRMANFLLVGIGESPLDTVRYIMDMFAETYQNLRLNYIQEAQGRFIFTGYYRQIFDILMLRKGVRSPVVVDPTRERIYFPEADLKIEKIHRREKALYALFLLESGSGGINFNRPQSRKQLERYEKRMRAVMQKYRLIYRLFGGDEDKTPNIENPEIRLPMISLLKRQITKLGSVLYHADDYTIQRNMYGNYAVRIPPALCCCCGADSTDICLLTEADEWVRIAAL